MNVVWRPPKGDADGWSYDGASNVVAFSGASVPALTGRVELQQYEEDAKGP